MRRNTVTNNVAALLIGKREPFKNHSGSFRGESAKYVDTAWSRLPREWQDMAREAEDVDYVVFSYNTPIAWHHANGWTIPDTKYSITTSKHQGVTRYGVTL